MHYSAKIIHSISHKLKFNILGKGGKRELGLKLFSSFTTTLIKQDHLSIF